MVITHMRHTVRWCGAGALLVVGVTALGAQGNVGTPVRAEVRPKQIVRSSAPSSLTVLRLREQYNSLLSALDTSDVGSQRYGNLLDEVLSTRSHIILMEQARTGRPDVQLVLGAVVDDEVWRMGGPGATPENQVSTLEALMPTGTLGITTDGIAKQHFRLDGFSVRYYEYPRIVRVEANTPAGNAGIAPGDLWLRYNGRDMREVEMNLTKIQVPSQPVTVTVARRGEIRDIPLVVTPSSEMTRQGRAGFLLLLIAQTPPSSVPGMAAAMRVPKPSSASPPGGVASAMRPRLGVQLLSGADLRELTQQVRERLGLPDGVWVDETSRGSIAYQQGIRGGDVITSVAGQRVRSLAELNLALTKWEGDRLRLDVVTKNRSWVAELAPK
jgi:membrane-associated protease RseP (regulator of RpoE activity)